MKLVDKEIAGLLEEILTEMGELIPAESSRAFERFVPLDFPVIAQSDDEVMLGMPNWPLQWLDFVIAKRINDLQRANPH